MRGTKKRKLMLYPPLPIDSMILARVGAPDGEHAQIPNGTATRCFPAQMTWDGRCYIDGVYQDLEFLQSTGLRDDKDREIYEGDILKREDGNWGYGGEYDKTHDGYLYTPVPSLYVMIGNCDWDVGYLTYSEVVGNIYENPELLSATAK